MRDILQDLPEINLSNFNIDDVDRLNGWALDAYDEIVTLRRHRDELHLANDRYLVRAREAEAKLREIASCFDAADAEGLQERINEVQFCHVGSWSDLVIRRLLPAGELARGAASVPDDLSARVDRLTAALQSAAAQLHKVHSDAFRQGAMLGLRRENGDEFNCQELNNCELEAMRVDEVLKRVAE